MRKPCNKVRGRGCEKGEQITGGFWLLVEAGLRPDAPPQPVHYHLRRVVENRSSRFVPRFDLIIPEDIRHSSDETGMKGGAKDIIKKKKNRIPQRNVSQ